MLILIVSPHTDDAELAAGGSIHKWTSQNNEVYHIVFYPRFKKEFIEASKVLGVPENNLIIKSMDRRTFPQNRQKICDCLYDLRQKMNPDLVVSPYINDVHQDHQQVSAECRRAFRRGTSILEYELIHNCVNFVPNYYIKISDENLQRKIEAVKCYKTESKKPYFHPELLAGLARIRGVQCDATYAEAFHAHRFGV